MPLRRRERVRRLLGRGKRLELETVLERKVAERVARAAGIDQIRGDLGVVGGRQPQAQALGVVGGDVRVAQRAGQPVGGKVANGHELAGRDRNPRLVELHADSTVRRELALAPRHLLQLTRDRHRRGERLVERIDATEQRPELEPPEDLLHRRAVGRPGDELGGLDAEVEIAAHRREHLRGSRLLGVLDDSLRSGR